MRMAPAFFSTPPSFGSSFPAPATAFTGFPGFIGRTGVVSPAVRTNPAGVEGPEGAVGATGCRAVVLTGSAITSPLRAKPLPREPINAGLATSGDTGDPTCAACVASMACTA